MPSISQSTLSNGLPLYKIEVEGTRSVTILVAFDAGARTERPEENGMAHFLEHLVFKGGEKYETYRDVNDAATVRASLRGEIAEPVLPPGIVAHFTRDQEVLLR